MGISFSLTALQPGCAEIACHNQQLIRFKICLFERRRSDYNSLDNALLELCPWWRLLVWQTTHHKVVTPAWPTCHIIIIEEAAHHPRSREKFLNNILKPGQRNCGKYDVTPEPEIYLQLPLSCACSPRPPRSPPRHMHIRTAKARTMWGMSPNPLRL